MRVEDVVLRQGSRVQNEPPYVVLESFHRLTKANRDVNRQDSTSIVHLEGSI